MLTVKNNTITLVKGESGQFVYTGITKEGTPAILPPSVDEPGVNLENRRDYAVLAFTVKTSHLGDVVLAKYFDLESYPMYDGVTDYTDRGYRKFTTNKIEKYVASQALEDAQSGVYKVYDDNGTYVHILKNKAGELVPAKYEFKFALPLEYNDTANLDAKQYVYDMIIYYGKLSQDELTANETGVQNFEFPLERIFVKNTIIESHPFIVKESNNV